MKRNESEVTLLGRMANLALSCLSREEAVAVAGRFLPQLFPRWTGVLYLRQGAQNFFEPAVSWGEERSWKAFEGRECWALRRHRIYTVGGDREQPPCPHTDFDPGRFTSFCIPMTAREDVLGLLHLLIPAEKEAREGPERNAGMPSTAERRLAALAADVLALLLVNLKLRKEMEDLSARDSQTGCYSRRHWEDALARELKTVQRSKRPFAVILMDVDHFGQFTEAYGHGASALVLRDLGAFLRENLRDVDMASRYGADEFALLLPDTTLETARRRAENLRELMKDLSLRDGRAHMRRVTLSMGVAACPGHGETMGDLMEAAKTALKTAKETGRDRVCTAAD